MIECNYHRERYMEDKVIMCLKEKILTLMWTLQSVLQSTF
jgi:hypothetical protein